MKESNHTLVRTLCETAVVLIIGLLAGFSSNALSSRSIPLVGQWDKAYGVPSPGGMHDATRGNVEIGAGDALRLFKEGAVFLDARPDEPYAERHIRGAYSLPEKQLAARMEEVLTMLERDEKVVVYCQGMECDEAHLLARALREAGRKDIFVFAGGMKEWEAAGYPVERPGGSGVPGNQPAAPPEL
ncbi:MAG: rhodanese-like domain-containing protein [Candidatus Aureabacteria bacterium]|nr:rhodanese-like domain-containing protein [Candidatus Auribacterota bacterium]